MPIPQKLYPFLEAEARAGQSWFCFVGGTGIMAEQTRSWLATSPGGPFVPVKGCFVAQNGLVGHFRSNNRLGDWLRWRRGDRVRSMCGRRRHL
jgi:hypothetical protein